jgi:hypothetical protein
MLTRSHISRETYVHLINVSKRLISSFSAVKTVLFHLSYIHASAAFQYHGASGKSSGSFRLSTAASRRTTIGLSSVGIGGTVSEITVKTL